MPDARPYPFDRLRRFGRREARTLTAWARATPLAALSRGGEAAASWLGAPIVLRPGGPERGAEPPPDAAVPSALLLRGDGAPVGLLIDPTVAAALIERTLGGEGDVPAAAGPLGELERGVLAYALGRWLAAADIGWRVAAVFAHPAAALEACGEGPAEARGEARVRWPLELLVGETRGPASLWLPARPEGAVARRAPEWARRLPVAISAVAGHAVLPARELATLRNGDVILPDRLDVAPGEEGLRGEVELCASGAPLGVRATVSGGTITCGTASDPATSGPTKARGEERDVSDGDDELSKMGDTPVTLSLEVARFELPLAEAAALCPGEVLSTGRPLGGEVVLRAGDRVVATGELVDVDGEIGVRIRRASAG